MSDDDIQTLKIELATLTERVSNWMVTTTDYRVNLFTKLDSLQDRLNKLPCDRRSSLSTQIKVIWGVMVVIIGAIVSEWVER